MPKLNDSLRKNCWNCHWLEWIDGDIGDLSGFICNNKPIDTDNQERKMLKQMESEDFMKRGKKCCLFKGELK
jgi:hypothetical protein